MGWCATEELLLVKKQYCTCSVVEHRNRLCQSSSNRKQAISRALQWFQWRRRQHGRCMKNFGSCNGALVGLGLKIVFSAMDDLDIVIEYVQRSEDMTRWRNKIGTWNTSRLCDFSSRFLVRCWVAGIHCNAFVILVVCIDARNKDGRRQTRCLKRRGATRSKFDRLFAAVASFHQN